MEENRDSRERHLNAGVVILAAGSSRRFGADKLFLPLGGKPVLAWSLDVFQRSPLIGSIVLVMNEENIQAGRELSALYRWGKVSEICCGGPRRQDSVKQGISRITNDPFLLIHDGARPFVTEDMIARGIEAADQTGAAVPAVPVKDTIKLGSSDNYVKMTLDRELLHCVQTPQVFRSDIIVQAYDQNTADVTDDAALVEKLGYRVKLFTGSYDNIKITTAEDMELACIIAERL